MPRTMITQTCLYCQTKFEAVAAEVARGGSKYCSMKCSGLARTASITPKEPNLTCAYCGVGFYKPEYRQKSKSGSYFCSKEHQGLAYADPSISVWSGPTNY